MTGVVAVGGEVVAGGGGCKDECTDAGEAVFETSCTTCISMGVGAFAMGTGDAGEGAVDARFGTLSVLGSSGLVAGGSATRRGEFSTASPGSSDRASKRLGDSGLERYPDDLGVGERRGGQGPLRGGLYR